MRKGAIMAGQVNKRKDKDRIVLRKGESQRKDGNYDYRWTTRDGKRHSVYAKTLEELRAKEDEILRDKCDGIKTEARYVTINDVFEVWKQLKRGLKDNTFQNYKYMYEQFVKPDFGNTRVSQLKKSDVKRFYNMLADERALKVSTIDSIHTVLHQVLDMAVDDAYLRNNPSDNVLKELKQAHNFDTEKRKALTVAEQELFLDFLRRNHQYNHWYPIFAVMVGTGLRVGEVTGLRWCDIDLKENLIDVNHTLVYYNHAENGCYFNINTPKTKAGVRNVPMLEFVKQAFIEERKYQMANGIRCSVKIDGYTDFIFVNRFGAAQHQGTLNKALRRIIRDCNDEVLERNEENPVLLPRFSCHSLRHTFTTRMCEAGVNIKVIQDALGHSDISTTLNIYADVTKELKKKEFEGLEAVFKSGAV
jgi:integrase